MKREVFIVIIGRFFQIITSVLVLRFATDRLSPEEMGKFALITTLTSLFALIFMNPVGMYVNRRLNSWHDDGVLGARLKTGIIYLLVMVLAASGILYLGYDLLGLKSTTDVEWIILLVGGGLLITTINQTIIPSLNMLGRRVEWIVYTLVTLWSGLVVAMWITVKSGKAELWISGQLIGMLIGAVLGVISLNRIIKPTNNKVTRRINWNKSTINSFLLFIMPVSLTVTLYWVQFQSYRFILNEMSTLQFLGLFTAGYTLSAGIVSALETTAMNYYYPMFYKRISNAGVEVKAAAWNNYASLLFPLAFLTLIFIVFMSSQLTRFLLDQKFWMASQFVILGAIVETGRALGNAYGMVAHATMNTKSLIIPQTIGALSAILFVPIFLRFFPEQGIGAALIASCLLFVFTMHKAMRKQLPIKLSIKSFYQVALFSIPILLIGLSSNYLRNNILIDIVVLLLAGSCYLLAAYFVIRRSYKNEKQVGM